MMAPDRIGQDDVTHAFKGQKGCIAGLTVGQNNGPTPACFSANAKVAMDKAGAPRLMCDAKSEALHKKIWPQHSVTGIYKIRILSLC